MSDINSSLALIHGDYSTVQNLWGYDINSNQVYDLDGTTLITYTFLQQLPDYYAGEAEAFNIPGTATSVFKAFDPNGILGQAIESILGNGSRTGFETSVYRYCSYHLLKRQ